MEHYRRLGFADEVRALGMPADFPTDIAYFTRFAGHELARFSLPSARDARQLVKTLSGSWSAAELPHRCNQKFIEPVLRRHAERLAGVSVCYGWRMTRFEMLENEVRVQIEPAAGGPSRTVRASYLVGGDGPRSPTRQALGIRYAGETGVTRDFVGGRMYAVYCRVPAFYREIPHAPAWMNVNFNRERRCFMPAVDGRQEFAFHTQLKPHEDEARVTDESAAEMVRQAIGAPLAVEVLARDTWTAGHSLVAERFGAGRVFIGGDAAHLFTPTGGLGYNTAVEDAVNLGWKLCRRPEGPGGAAPSRELRRRAPSPRRAQHLVREGVRRFARHRAAPRDRGRGRGGRARAKAGRRVPRAPRRGRVQHPGHHLRRPLRPLARDRRGRQHAAARPAERLCAHGVPGGRPPHLWLGDGRSLFDAFGFEWTLLRLGKAQGTGFERAAQRLGLDLTVFDLRTRRSARALRRRARAHPPRPGRRLARRRRPRGRKRTCEAHRPWLSHHHEHHHHDHHHHDHTSRHGAGHAPALHGAAILTLAFAVVEAAGGWWTGSLALLSDAGHMLTDGAALATCRACRVDGAAAAFGAPLLRPGPRRGACRAGQCRHHAAHRGRHRIRGARAVAVAAAGQGRRGSAHRRRGTRDEPRHPAAAESARPRSQHAGGDAARCRRRHGIGRGARRRARDRPLRMAAHRRPRLGCDRPADRGLRAAPDCAKASTRSWRAFPTAFRSTPSASRWRESRA